MLGLSAGNGLGRLGLGKIGCQKIFIVFLCMHTTKQTI